MNAKEKQALKNLEEAFKVCSSLGMKFAGMDGDFLYATKKGEKIGQDIADKKSTPYCPVAEVVRMNKYPEDSGSVNTYSSYTDSGGY